MVLTLLMSNITVILLQSNYSLIILVDRKYGKHLLFGANQFAQQITDEKL